MDCKIIAVGKWVGVFFLTSPPANFDCFKYFFSFGNKIPLIFSVLILIGDNDSFVTIQPFLAPRFSLSFYLRTTNLFEFFYRGFFKILITKIFHQPIKPCGVKISRPSLKQAVSIEKKHIIFTKSLALERIIYTYSQIRTVILGL